MSTADFENELLKHEGKAMTDAKHSIIAGVRLYALVVKGRCVCSERRQFGPCGADPAEEGRQVHLGHRAGVP